MQPVVSTQQLLYHSDMDTYAVALDGAIPIIPAKVKSAFGRKAAYTTADLDAMVAAFNAGVPGFRPPVKITHEDQHGAAGWIARLERRGDTLYGIPEWTTDGRELLDRQRFRYISAELRRNVDYEGDTYPIVLVGAALVNDPYFGEDTALFSIDDGQEEAPMTSIDSEAVGKGVAQGLAPFLTDLFKAWGKRDAVAPAPQDDDERYAALERQAADARAEADRLTAQATRATAEQRYSALLPTVATATHADLAEVAITNPDLADRLAQQYKALAEQSKLGAILEEVGSQATGDIDPVTEYRAVLKAKKDAGLSDLDAINAVAMERPELIDAYRRGGKSHG